MGEVLTGLKWLPDVRPETYSLPGEYGDMPHALLRRTSGAVGDEVWAPTEFELSRDKEGWLTLAFLAWWMRDLSRAGRQVQLRPIALPPKAQEVQLGRMLGFILDQFIDCPNGDLAPALEAMEQRGRSLSLALNVYAGAVGDLVRPAE